MPVILFYRSQTTKSREFLSISHFLRRAIGLLHDYLARAREAQHATERMLASSAALHERLNYR